MVLPIIVIDIAGAYSFHDSGNGLLVFLQPEVDVFIHEAVGMDFAFDFSAVSCEGIEESFIIIIRGEDVLLVDAPGHEMINSSTHFDTATLALGTPIKIR